ncbi:MAG: hypothetical protein KAG61_12440 [Bacteriovoracaceae bacterium]|nr:hypothetical protein [Bacteriovoracaceae bacterium]
MNIKNEKFQGRLGAYKVIYTEDQTPTLWSEYFDENCHSLSGAVAETIFNYIEPTKVIERATSSANFTILEVGFGLGTGVNTTLEALDHIEGARVKIISLELDPKLVEWAMKNNTPKFTKMPSLSDLKLVDLDGITSYQTATEWGEIIIPIGNARETVLKLAQLGIAKNIHAIYQDAFSPKKNPILWTVEWFEALKSVSHPSAILSTYSASSSVKKALCCAGWIPEHRKGFKGKRQSISATLSGKMSQDMQDHLSRSPVRPGRD